MTDKEDIAGEIEDYRKMLEGWKPKPPAPRQSPLLSSIRPPTSHDTKPIKRPSPYMTGSILLLDDDIVIIYQKPTEEKNIHQVAALTSDHGIQIINALFENSKITQLGQLDDAWLKRMLREKRWNRDLLVFHCNRFEDCVLIPPADHMKLPMSVDISEEQPRPSAPHHEETIDTSPSLDGPLNALLKRGQHIHVRFGANEWHAVYWGRDDQGSVVAHKTYASWELMHLDLNRFGTGLVINPEIDPDIVRQIEEDITSS